MAGVRIDSFEISDGTLVDVARSSIVLIVGPNNSGKSQALRDILKGITSEGERGVAIRGVGITHIGDASALRERFETDGTVVKRSGGDSVVQLGAIVGSQPLSSVLSWWPNAMHLVAGYFALLADTETRLHASRPVQGLNLFEEHPTHPLHHVYRTPILRIG